MPCLMTCIPMISVQRYGYEPHAVPGLEQHRVCGGGVEKRDGRTPYDVPSARRRHRIDAGLYTGDAHAPGGYMQCRRPLPGRRDAFIHHAPISETRQEADHIYLVFRPEMQADQHLGREPPLLADRRLVRAERRII